jgi:hypothetical protein
MKPNNLVKHLGFLSGLFLLSTGCVKEEVSSGDETPASSFAYIQTRIFDKKCVVCHTAGDEYAEESGLVLTGNTSFRNLVGVDSKNEKAKLAGMPRVSPGHPEKSLLYLKLLMSVDGDSLSGYGHPMPFGKTPLSNGQIEFVRQWIMAGAPDAGHVVSANLLLDTIPAKAPEFTPLAPPAAGQGYQIKVDKFAVSPQFEREFFMYKSLGNPAEIHVNKIKIKMRSGSHHFLLYMYDPKLVTPANLPESDVFRDMRNLDGTLNLKNMTALGDLAYVVAGTQIPEDSLTLPAGVAIKLPANISFDFNSHYVNYTDAVTYGEVACNMYTVEASQVKHEAHALNMGNRQFKLPAGQTTTITTDFPVGAYMKAEGLAGDSMSFVTLFSHTHKLGKKFVVVAKGGAHAGDTLYVNDNWHHPPYKNFDPPLVLSAADTVTSVVTYENTTDKEVGFGFRSVDEMDIIFGYWY